MKTDNHSSKDRAAGASRTEYALVIFAIGVAILATLWVYRDHLKTFFS